MTPPTVNEVVDTTGAGDAFLGGLIVGIPEITDLYTPSLLMVY